MSIDKRPQAFRATYSVTRRGPQPEMPVVKENIVYYWRVPGSENKHYLMSSGIAFDPRKIEDMKLLGGEIIEEKEVERESPPLLSKRFKPRLEREPGIGVTFGGSSFCLIVVETETSLSQEEHRRRRTLVEKIIREEGCSFELECYTVHSSDVCQPLIKEVAPDAA